MEFGLPQRSGMVIGGIYVDLLDSRINKKNNKNIEIYVIYVIYVKNNKNIEIYVIRPI